MDQLKVKLLEYLNNTDAFLKEQASEFVSQLLEYELWATRVSYLISVVFVVVSMIVSLILLYFGIQLEKDGLLVIAVFSFVGMGVSVVFGCWYYFSLQKLRMAPKVYLIEEVKRICSS